MFCYCIKKLFERGCNNYKLKNNIQLINGQIKQLKYTTYNGHGIIIIYIIYILL